VIVVSIHPDKIPVDQPTDVTLRLTNTGSGACTNVCLIFRLPLEILLIRGRWQVQVSRLGKGQHHDHVIQLRARRQGIFHLKSTNFSYRDPMGRGRRVPETVIPMQVVAPVHMPVPALELTLETTGVPVGKWSPLSGRIANVGDGSAQGIVLFASGPSLQAHREPVEDLLPGQVLPFTLSVCAAELGIRVPIRLEATFRDGSGRLRRHSRRAHVAVEAAWPNVEGTQIGMNISSFDALLIGIGNYIHPAYASLSATVRDVQAIAAVLTDPARCGYPPSSVKVVTGPDATAANIRAALKGLGESENPKSTAFVYFSGHGGRALENTEWSTYLCPREADPDDLAHTAIPGDEFSALLAAIPACRLLVMLDTCHAAGSAELKTANGTVVWKAGLSDDYYEALSRGSGRVIIASSKEYQFSYIRPQGDLSLFTHHLIQAISGKAAVRSDGLIHVLDIFHYVNEAVQASEPKQTPILKVKDLDLNFPIALDRGGKGGGPAISVTPVTDIREQIVRNPIAGARALSGYLAARPEWAAKRNEVDLKRADLERIQHELDLFGPDPSNQATKNQAVYFLLRVCLELERPEQ
jgi:hypothetical protein